MKLQDRVGVVTGAAHGIGRAIAIALAKEKATVIVADIDRNEALKVVEEIEALGAAAIAVKVDVTQSEEVKEMVNNIVNRFAKIDILVNNAGGSAREKSSLFYKSQEEVWDSVIERNLKSVFICTRAVIEHMMKRRSGKIVNISSCTGLVGYPGLVDYAASKAGVIGFTHALAQEVASYGINVNCVAPGPTETRAMDSLPSEKFGQLTGLGRLGKPEEIAAMVVFLTTDDANFIAGQVFPVCGLRNLGAR